MCSFGEGLGGLSGEGLACNVLKFGFLGGLGLSLLVSALSLGFSGAILYVF